MLGKIKLMPAALVVFILFGLQNGYEVICDFGEQAVDLPPFQFFLFSVWVAIRNFLGYTLIPVALVFLLGKLSRWLLIPAILFVVGIPLCASYVARTFHASLYSEWLILLMTTNYEEVVNFISMAMTPAMILSTLVFVLIAVAVGVLIWKARYPRFGWRSSVVGVALLLPFIVFNCLTMNMHFGVNQMSYMHFIIGGVLSWKEGQGLRNACLCTNVPEELSIDAGGGGGAPVGVIILGESETRNSWHLYGYSRDTTPCMDRFCAEDGAYAFTDVVGTQPATVGALSLLLTDVSFDDNTFGNWTLAEVFRRAGYECSLISMQWWGDPNESSVLVNIFNGCTKRFSMLEDGKKHNVRRYDEDVVPHLARELETGNDPKIIFIHLAGMHYPVKDIIPVSEAHFTDSIESDCLRGMDEYTRDRNNRYDDAIRYEDKVLGMLTDVLKNSDRVAWMMFVSDHGESPRAKNWRDYADFDVYEVPMIVWLSSKYKDAFPETAKRVAEAANKPMQQDELTYGLLELGRVKGVLDWEDDRNFLSPNFKGRSPRYVDKGRMVYERRK